MRPGISARQLPTDQQPAGQGDVPLAAALSAVEDLAYAVIEFDHYEGDIFDGVTQSYQFLPHPSVTQRLKEAEPSTVELPYDGGW